MWLFLDRPRRVRPRRSPSLALTLALAALLFQGLALPVAAAFGVRPSCGCTEARPGPRCAHCHPDAYEVTAETADEHEPPCHEQGDPPREASRADAREHAWAPACGCHHDGEAGVAAELPAVAPPSPAPEPPDRAGAALACEATPALPLVCGEIPHVPIR